MANSEQLIAVLLSESQDQLARELPLKLGISQPSFSRLVKSTSNVVHYGSKLSKKYTIKDPKFGFDAIPIYQVDDEGRVSNFGTLYPVRGGRFVFEPMHGSNTVYDGLPWFIDYLRPQGFLGRRFPQQNPDLGLPDSINDWGDSDVVKALYFRGEDLPGNLIIGSESVARYLQKGTPTQASRSDYPTLAIQAISGEIPASSAAGEQPKFTCFDGHRHLIVKFSPVSSQSEIAQRWGDLLICEYIANKVLFEAGIPSAKTVVFSERGRFFLESERFDRTAKGRRAMVSLAALDLEFIGFGSGWVRCVSELHKHQKVSGDTLIIVSVLEMFGKMIGNSDMHLGNLSFFADKGYKKFSIAPVYDMLPMYFAPTSQGEIVNKELKIPTPTPENINCWTKAREIAERFWKEVVLSELISEDFKTIAQKNHFETQKLFCLSDLIVCNQCKCNPCRCNTVFRPAPE